MKVIKGKYCGFCSGVKTSVNLAEECASSGVRVYTLGEVIHNPQVVEKLREKNIISINNPEDIPSGSIALIRSHGITIEMEDRLRKMNLNVIDATCRNVKRAHKICGGLAERFSRVFIVGVHSHPEVKGILSRSMGKGVVISSENEAEKAVPVPDAGILVQTTYRKEKFVNILNILTGKAKNIEIHNTICEETLLRQEELKKIAEVSDIIIIAGGKNSSNTKRLFELAKEKCRAYHIEVPEELEVEWLKGASTVAIAAGASTPKWLVQEIEDRILKNEI